MNLRSTLTITGALLGAGALLAPAATAADSPGKDVSKVDPMTSYVMERDGRTQTESGTILKWRPERPFRKGTDDAKRATVRFGVAVEVLTQIKDHHLYHRDAA